MFAPGARPPVIFGVAHGATTWVTLVVAALFAAAAAGVSSLRLTALGAAPGAGRA